jgi:GMP synthase (glutamine-hydrolysing)
VQPHCLYIAYRPEWGDNRARDVLENLGWTVEVRCPARGDAVPDSAAAFSGVIIGGGLDDVIESSRPAYVDRLITLTRDCLERDTPFIGFCFGAQVLVAAGGGQVLTRADGRGAYGYRRIEPSGPAGRAALAGLDHACHLHYHGFEAPMSAVRLAAGTLFPDSAFRLGNRAWGFQFHPEIRADQLEGVLSHLGEEALARDGADAPERQLRDAARHDAGVQAWLARFLREWCAAA